MQEVAKMLLGDPRMPKLFDDVDGDIRRFISEHGLFGMIGGWEGSQRFSEIMADRRRIREWRHPNGYARDIVVHETATVHPSVVIEGLTLIGPYCEVRANAVIRAGTWLMRSCVVGSFCEVKNSLFFPGAHASHQNYVGDSILGRDVNLGAGVKLANFRHNGGLITIKAHLDTDDRIVTGLRKCGAILGDGVKIGCGSVLSPGTVIGAGALVHEMTPMRSGVYEGNRRYWIERQVSASDI
ncbi:hypothetical protein HQ524_03495 [Candidatus Uhrbacteria bacterium]|nr:hypothetical protein [Candidatus Uhrbacteria bacterium]